MSALAAAPIVSQIRSVAVSVVLITRFDPVVESSVHSTISHPAPIAIPKNSAVKKNPIR
jgi:hypothetical protein